MDFGEYLYRIDIQSLVHNMKAPPIHEEQKIFEMIIQLLKGQQSDPSQTAQIEQKEHVYISLQYNNCYHWTSFATLKLIALYVRYRPRHYIVMADKMSHKMAEVFENFIRKPTTCYILYLGYFSLVDLCEKKK